MVHQPMDMSLSKLWEIKKDKETQRVRHNLVTKQNKHFLWRGGNKPIKGAPKALG